MGEDPAKDDQTEVETKIRAALRSEPQLGATFHLTALTIEPDEDAYYQRGQIYESLGQHEKAIADYNAAIGLLPNAPYVYRARATSELGLGDRDAARHDRSLALAIEHPGRDGSQ